MNNWQEWAVAFLLLLCAVRIGMRVYSFFYRVKEKSNPCDSCVTGCDLKRPSNEKPTDSTKGKRKKCCCG